MNPPVAILSLACRYAEADSPEALWENTLAGRRSFRQIPPERLAVKDYASAVVGPSDSLPEIPAGLISDWSFNRTRYRVPRAAYETADLSHWLALDVAADAIERIGGADVLPKDQTSIILGNTLTGEFSRAAQLRFRLPYLREKLNSVLAAQGLDEAERLQILSDFSEAVATDFAEPNEESLAGALANTIAGRIANHFDFRGGAWTVDGACASSLLAVADAVGRLSEGVADAAIVGGVDLSLDPFELVGFARTGALAERDMQVFGNGAEGFWPGEGCGMAVLGTAALADRLGLAPIAWIIGTGRSTDGAGGLIRPSQRGQVQAVGQAWNETGHHPVEAGYFEAHGTGTAVGDPVELGALAEAIGMDGARIPVGSIKANIGHCKAAAGIAGLIRAAKSVQEGIVPPHAGCEVPCATFEMTGHRLTPSRTATYADVDPVVGVSAFGFGGINTHIVLQGPSTKPAAVPAPPSPRPQDAELFVFAEPTPTALATRLDALHARAEGLSWGELADAAAEAARNARTDFSQDTHFREAIVATTPRQLKHALREVLHRIGAAAPASAPPQIGFLFPGQAAPCRPNGGAWRRRFAWLEDQFQETGRESDTTTSAAQPAIHAASMAGLELMHRAKIAAHASLGHSLGEYAALVWSGALTRDDAKRLVAARGRVMSRHAIPGGAMMRVAATLERLSTLLLPEDIEIACINGASEIVLAGPEVSIARSAQIVALEGIDHERLAVSHAFHSKAMHPAEKPLAEVLATVNFDQIVRPIMSSVTGALIAADEPLAALLRRQLTAPVLFANALETLSASVDLFVELGPGQGMARLAREAGHEALAVDAGAAQLATSLETLAELWRRNVGFDTDFLFCDRQLRPLGAAPKLLAHPCGRPSGKAPPPPPAKSPLQVYDQPIGQAIATPETDALEVVRATVADTAGLPVDLISAESRLLEDLHLNSLSVGRVVQTVAAKLDTRPPIAPTDLGAATVADVARLIAELAELDEPRRDFVEGVGPWVAEYSTVWRTATPLGKPVSSPKPARVLGPPLNHQAMTAGDEMGVVNLLTDCGARDAIAAARRLWSLVKEARRSGISRLAILHQGMQIAGFARSLLADGAFESIRIIELAGDRSSLTEAAALKLNGLLATHGPTWQAWRLFEDGTLQSSSLEHRPLPSLPCTPPLHEGDTLLVSGGSRGIGSEAALALGESLGLRLVLLGRSAPDTSQVTSTLKAARLRGIDARYLSVDVCDYESLANALASLKAPFDRIDGLLHAAGVNTPAHFDSIDDEALQACLAPKLLGLENLLRASEDRGCRLAVGFGSMISTLGLAGESHYALANGEMSARLERWARETGRLSLTLDWSVWAGAGMGERLGAVERLAAQGVQAIPLEHALERLVKLFSTLDCGGRFMVTGRFADHNDTLFEPRVLHDGRFVSSRRLLYPGVEAIFDARIAPGSDPWLDDHVVDGVRVVPGVMLLEAMAQAAITVTDAPLSGFSDVAFLQAICPDDHGVDLRIAVLRRDDGTVSATVRASDDGFAADRCAATLVTGKKAKMDDLVVQRQGEEPLDGWAIYPALCFAKGRFRRIDSIEALSAFALHAKISAPDKRPWFGPFESSILQLGDPGARDAGLHVLQACVPQTLVLPVSVREIQIADTITPRRSVEALEISSDGTEFEFDILYRGAEGQALEYWRGARFRATGQRCIADLPAALLATALERSAATIAGRRNVRIASAGTRGDCDRRRMVLSTLGIECSWKRGDGAAEILGKDAVSLSHSASLTLGIRGKPPVACDVVDPGAEADRALAPEDARLLSGFGSAAGAGASALVWAARECARKGAQPAGQPLVRLNPGVDDQPIFRCGTALIICNRFAETGAAAILLNSGDIQDQEVRA